MNFGILNFKEVNNNTTDESNNPPPSQYLFLSPSLQHYASGFPSSSSITSSSSSSNSSNSSQTAHTPEFLAEDIPPPFDTRPEEPAPPPPRRTIRKHKEPIFVTEVPQNAYKKKRNRGLSSSEEDEAAAGGADATNKSKMTAKERRQLRNKISARNFRVRRKEYIEQLEYQISKQDKELALLRESNARLEKVNQELLLEVERWRSLSDSQQQQQQQQQQPAALLGGDNTSGGEALPDLFNFFELNDLDLFDFNVNVSNAVIPHFDFARVLNEKPDPRISSAELMRSFPLLAPTLMSMIIGQTMALVSEQEIMSTAVMAQPTTKITFPEPPQMLVASERHQRQDAVPLEKEHMVDEAIERWLLRKHYLYYAFMRMRGYSHAQLIQRARQYLESSAYRERRMERLQRVVNTISAFCSITSTLLQHPERAPLVPSMIRNDKRLDWHSSFSPKGSLEYKEHPLYLMAHD
ncbi:hypothetical protein O0I10_011730 [Lichtheimia ornata]|uniref:BZIP domain-containing protein n=1 Tax=Lichtheimia ornata TaxID=688661 RepID=A0AAD7UU27_9FUNG|nr:uncharacterized protein O0I10_011730 [Lichtheimia ornata]KAJ8652652.1 hypothetical protein O0I10_011730 [Lichtheimia ornata]